MSKRRPIITERSDGDINNINRTSRARKYLYELIAMFRKDAEDSDDEQTSSMFSYAANVASELVRVFQNHENEVPSLTNSRSEKNNID